MSTESPVASVLAELTLEEKASLCLGSDFWHTTPVARLGVPAITLSDGPLGLRRQPDEGDHVGISGSLPATCFPTASALGSSFDPELVRRVGEALGEEARAQDVQVLTRRAGSRAGVGATPPGCVRSSASHAPNGPSKSRRRCSSCRSTA